MCIILFRRSGLHAGHPGRGKPSTRGSVLHIQRPGWQGHGMGAQNLSKSVPSKYETLTQCWANVEDGGPTLKQHWVNVSCFLGLHHG